MRIRALDLGSPWFSFGPCGPTLTIRPRTPPHNRLGVAREPEKILSDMPPKFRDIL